MKKKNIVVFSGAGISVESGIPTFRDAIDGLWYNYKVEEVATLTGWKKDKQKVLDFHNIIRKTTHDVSPNIAHKLIAKLEDNYNVTIITQNVDELHEKSGSSTVLHIHGNIMKSRSTLDPNLIYDCRGDINIGDKCIKGSQLRPHSVLFGEFPYHIDESILALNKADVLIIVGTGFDISYTSSLMGEVNKNTIIYYIDPSPSSVFSGDFEKRINYIIEKATIGVKMVIDELNLKYL